MACLCSPQWPSITCQFFIFFLSTERERSHHQVVFEEHLYTCKHWEQRWPLEACVALYNWALSLSDWIRQGCEAPRDTFGGTEASLHNCISADSKGLRSKGRTANCKVKEKKEMLSYMKSEECSKCFIVYGAYSQHLSTKDGHRNHGVCKV